MEKYGFFGGSFNPVTKAHVDLALEIIEKYKLDKVIFIPVGNAYVKKGLIDEQHRFNMLKIAICKYDKLEVSNIELNQSKNLTTLEAFKMIEMNYPNIDKYYIMGMDNMHKMLLSKDVDTLLRDFKYIIIERGLIESKALIKSNEYFKKNEQNFIIMENVKYGKTSSTMVRDGLQQANSKLEDVMDENVLDYIKINKLYQN